MDWWEFFFVLLVVLPITVLWLGCIIDAIARPDLSGWSKALWTLFILFVPLIGAMVYIVVRPSIIVAPRSQGMDPSWGADPASYQGSTPRPDRSTNVSI
jgi:hypothetical protein